MGAREGLGYPGQGGDYTRGKLKLLTTTESLPPFLCFLQTTDPNFHYDLNPTFWNSHHPGLDWRMKMTMTQGLGMYTKCRMMQNFMLPILTANHPRYVTPTSKNIFTWMHLLSKQQTHPELKVQTETESNHPSQVYNLGIQSLIERCETRHLRVQHPSLINVKRWHTIKSSDAPRDPLEHNAHPCCTFLIVRHW